MIAKWKVRYLVPWGFFDTNKTWYQNMEVYHNIFLIIEVSEKHPSNLIPTVPHLELPNTEKVSLANGYAKLFFAILTFKCLKSVTTLLSLVSFLLINITWLEYADNPSFNILI